MIPKITCEFIPIIMPGTSKKSKPEWTAIVLELTQLSPEQCFNSKVYLS